MFKTIFTLLAVVVPCAPVYAQNVDIGGISLGMTLPQAESHLAGFTLAPQKVPYPPNFQLVYGIKGTELYALETIDGTLVFIDRVIYLPKGSEPDAHTYAQQIFAKYGPQSPGTDTSHGSDSGNAIPDPKGQRVRNMGWQYDATGKQIPETECPLTPGNQTGFITLGNLPPIDPTGKHTINSFFMVSRYSPNHIDYPSCHVHLDVLQKRSQTTTPPQASDVIEFRLYDPSKFFPVIEKLANAQKEKDDAARKEIGARKGPPL